MIQHRYVVVSSDGRSWLLQGDQQYDQNADNNHVLPRLLGDGWQPVRERALGDKDSACALVLLKFVPPGDDCEIPF